jgi:hypothetical protein
VAARLAAAGLTAIEIRPDSQGHDRIAVARRATSDGANAATMDETPRAAGQGRR